MAPKNPGGQAPSEKFLKQEAEKHGLGAFNAPGHTQGTAPGEKPVASDSGNVNVGIDSGASNVPGEKGIGGPVLASSHDGKTGSSGQGQGNMQ